MRQGVKCRCGEGNRKRQAALRTHTSLQRQGRTCKKTGGQSHPTIDDTPFYPTATGPPTTPLSVGLVTFVKAAGPQPALLGT